MLFFESVPEEQVQVQAPLHGTVLGQRQRIVEPAPETEIQLQFQLRGPAPEQQQRVEAPAFVAKTEKQQVHDLFLTMASQQVAPGL